MTAYTTSTSDRCDAQNKLTCRVHGVAGNFTEVPTYVRDNIHRLQNLNEDFQDKRSTYLEYAKELGIAPADITYVIEGGFATDASEDEIEGLVNLYNEYTEAAQAADEESELQSREVSDFLNKQLKDHYPHGPEPLREMMKTLVGLRFVGDETNLELEARPEVAAPLFQDIYRSAASQRGGNRHQLFGLLGNAQVRRDLRDLDRAYFTALSGRIPTDAQLDSVEEARQRRAMGPVGEFEKDNAFKLAIRLSSPE